MITFSARRAFKFIHITSQYYTSTTQLDPLLSLLQLAIDRRSLNLTQQSHTQVYYLGLIQHSVIITKLISAYSVCKNPDVSRLVFNSVRLKNVFLWNTLINGHAKNCLCYESFELFNKMCRDGESPDNFTLSTMAKVCADIKELVLGKLFHGKCVRIGFVSDTVLANAFMFMYCKCEEFGEARKVFDEMPQRNVSSWNVMIGGYAGLENNGVDREMWEFLKYMQIEGFEFDGFTLSSVLPLCGSNTGKCDYGRELHCYIVKNDKEFLMESDVHLGCCLIDMYSKSNRVYVGRKVFDRLKCRNVFTWTAMINGYVLNGAFDEAMFLFGEMQNKGGVGPNKVSLVSILPACSSVAGLLGGKQVHGFAVRNELHHEVSLGNSLIDMYSKCGSLNYARKVFDFHCIYKDAISWSSMITGYGLHGKGQEAIMYYKKMLQSGIKPDSITVVGALSACSRSEMVEEGLSIYSAAINEHGFKPTLEICSCMVDMLGRSGQLDKALNFIKTMPIKPGPSIWGALVGASELHGNSYMRDLAYNFLINVEPANPSNYVSLSNLYASSRNWNAVAEVRSMMKERGFKKLPGCSWISINSETHSFYVADKAHPCSDMIYEMVHELILEMKGTDNSTDIKDLTYV